MRHLVILNIGLDDSESQPPSMTREQRLAMALGRLQRYAAHGAVTMRLAQSDTEPTLVVQFYCTLHAIGQIRSTVFELACELGQEAIAVVVDGDGYLIGPAAESWGAFDPGRFIMPHTNADVYDYLDAGV